MKDACKCQHPIHAECRYLVRGNTLKPGLLRSTVLHALDYDRRRSFPLPVILAMGPPLPSLVAMILCGSHQISSPKAMKPSQRLNNKA